MKRAIVLSGGGSKGAYELGVWKALRKLHISYDIVTGTSVGSLNGAMMVQKSYHRAKKLWSNLSFNTIFESDLAKNPTTKQILEEYGKNIIVKGGMDVTNLENLLKKCISSKRFFKSKIDYGLVTYNLSSKKPILKNKKDLTPDNLYDFLIASSTCFPAFKMKQIDGDKYIDGGYFDNLPINLAISLCADEIIAVDLEAIGLTQEVKNKNIPITYIHPHNTLASFLYFEKHSAKLAIKYGYFDTLKQYGKFDGNSYTFYKGQINKLLKYYPILTHNLKEILTFNTQHALDKLLKTTLYKNIFTKEDYLNKMLDIIEDLGKNFHINDTRVYTINTFNKQLAKQLKMINDVRVKEIETKIKNKQFADLLNTKWLVLFLFDKINSCKTDKQKRILLDLANLMPKEFLKALYLYTIRR